MASKPPRAAKLKYIETLDPTSRARYFNKLQLIDSIDPYDVPKKDWSSDEKGLPEVTYPDIVNYLVHTQSAYTLSEMKSFKSLESYNHFVCGWVKDLLHFTANNYVVVAARVKHSQRMNDAPLQPWVLCEKDGNIVTGHCNCMAGLGEACSHIGAVLFYVDATVKIRNSKTVTQEPAYWLLPRGIQKVGYDTIQNIDFQSAKTLKRNLDEQLCSPKTPKRQMLGQNLPNVSSPSQSEVSTFLSKLHNTGTKPVLLALMPDYAANYVPRHLGEEYPSILSDLFREDCSNMNRGDLLDHCKELFHIITVSDLQATNVESTTRLQTGCKQWFRFRTGRVTASKMKSVCATSVDKPSPSLVKQICYPSQVKFSTDVNMKQQLLTPIVKV